MSNAGSGARIKWIDCAKALAILAVVVDHCGKLYDSEFLRLPEGYGGYVSLLYESPMISVICWFSVSLFMLLSGVSAWISSGNGERIAYGRQLVRVGRLLLQYAAATLAIQLIQTRTFALDVYVRHLLFFDIQGIYYYLFVLLQLSLLSPLLVRWCRFCGGRGKKWLWHAGTLAVLCGIAILCIRYTRTLPLFGAGKFLFGGTYLVLFDLGILLQSERAFERTAKQEAVILGASSVLLVLWLRMLRGGLLPFDGWLASVLPEILTPIAPDSVVFGNVMFLSNPPGIEMAVYAVLLMFAAFAFFSLLEKWGRLGCDVAELVSRLGRHTLPVYLYHFMIRDLLLIYLPWESMGIWTRRAVFVIPMIFIPVLGAWLAGRMKRALRGEKGQSQAF